MRNNDGFSLVETIVAVAVVATIAGTMFQLLDPANGVFEIEVERADMQQRVRASAESLFKDLVMAGAGGQIPPIAPFRRGAVAADPAGTAFEDRVSVRYLPSDTTFDGLVLATYWTRTDKGVGQLMQYDGRETDLPVSDQISALRFEYFDNSGSAIPFARFRDGPWLPDAVSADRFDIDLLAVRRVRVSLRVHPARTFLHRPLGDQTVSIGVSPRNLNLQ
jgi:prepilin-type N-terminal cleavage/methylation domain-containing protein